jgi:two-component system OmpR family response regulator
VHDPLVRLSSRRTIIVIEESASVQELLEHALREAGHRVLVTRDPREAFELARRVRIDALVCDLAIVEQRGSGLVRRLRELQPSLPVLYLADQGPAGEEALEDGSTLQTPFSLDELQEAVAAAIDRRTG